MCSLVYSFIQSSCISCIRVFTPRWITRPLIDPQIWFHLRLLVNTSINSLNSTFNYSSIYPSIHSSHHSPSTQSFLQPLRFSSQREGSPRTTCRSRGLCKCFSKLTRRAFCCDCLGGPCFPGDSTVLTPSGVVSLDRLSVGDLVLAGLWRC